jgi:integrase
MARKQLTIPRGLGPLVNNSRFKGKPKQDRYLRPDEFKKLLVATEYDIEANVFFRVMGMSGMRSIEAELLRWEHVDFEQGGMWVWTAKRKDHPTRFIALDAKTMAKLKVIYDTYVRTRPTAQRKALPVFHRLDVPITRRRMKSLFKKCAKRAGLRPALSMHSLRHYHATECVKIGMTPQDIAARLGHKGLNMVMEYYTLSVDRNKSFADKMGKELE